MEKSQTDLSLKVCQNCLLNFQKLEDTELKLAEQTRKAARLEEANQRLQKFKSEDLDSQDYLMQSLRAQNQDLEAKVIELEGLLES